jgi:hypothetical protein
MVRGSWPLLGGCLLLWAGCSQSTDELRTYSEGTDGTAAVGATGESGKPAVSPAAAQTAHIGEEAIAIKSTSADASPPASSLLPTEPVDAPSGTADDIAAAESPSRPPRVPLPQRLARADGLNGVSITSVTADRPREIKLLVPEKKFARIDGGKSLRVTYDDIDLLKILNMDPVPADCVDHFPEWLKALDGQQIRIKGFMIPQTREDGITGFEMARDTQLCCFGRAPKPYDVFPVFLKPGTSVKYIHMRPFDVVGRFAIRPFAYKGKIEDLYEIEDAEVITN